MSNSGFLEPHMPKAHAHIWACGRRVPINGALWARGKHVPMYGQVLSHRQKHQWLDLHIQSWADTFWDQTRSAELVYKDLFSHKQVRFQPAHSEISTSLCCYCLCPMLCKTVAPCEARTHDLQIMRLTRCQLRQRGYVTAQSCLHRRTHCYNAITLYLHYYYTFITSVRVGLGLGCDLI